MQNSKMNLNIFPSKSKFTKISIRNQRISRLYGHQKLVTEDDVTIYRPIQLESANNLCKKKNFLKSRRESVQDIRDRNTVNFLKKSKSPRNQLPQIYNPQPAVSVKFFSNHNQRQGTTKKITQPILNKKKSNDNSKQHHKTQLSHKHRLFKDEAMKKISISEKFEINKVIRNEFHELINATNNMSVRNINSHFRAFIEKGNNGIMVKQILKKRWWWHFVDDPSKANLIWTQWYNKAVGNSLDSLTIQNEIINIKQYRQPKKQVNISDKTLAIKKIVDENTFEQLQDRINKQTKNYFKIDQRKHNNKAVSVSFRHSQMASNQMKIHTVDEKQIIHNHVEGCLNLHSKKLLFLNFHKFMIMKNLDVFKYIPITLYLQSYDSSAINELFDCYDRIGEENGKDKNIWIVKPGENSNRGNGIKVIGSKQQLEEEIQRRLSRSGNSKKTIIIQKYLQECFLINKRKFDIRCYLLVTTVNGVLKGYWYKDGYIRTSSSEYTLDDVDDQLVHLTNDAIQKKGQNFGKHEDHNKMSYEDFQKYLRKNGISPKKFDITNQEMKRIAFYLMSSVATKIKRKQFTFELFGLDYMLDAQLKPYLIEANSNPCLQNNGKIMGHLMHELIENVMMTAIDPVFPPPSQLSNKKITEILSKDCFQTNKFQLIFTSQTSSEKISQLIQ